MGRTQALTKIDASNEHLFPVKVWDQVDERSIWNLASPEVQKAMLRVPRELRGIHEHELKKQVKPSVTACRIRIGFWVEYNRCQEAQDKFNLTKAYAGICSHEFFFEHFLAVPEYVAWLMCPPASYTNAMEEALNLGIEELRDILQTPHTGNPKIMELKVKIFAMLDARLKGAVVQKLSIEQRSLNMNIGVPKGDSIANPDDVAEIDKRIAQLERKARRQINQTDPEEIEIDVGPKTDQT